MDKAYSNFTEISKIPLTAISHLPVTWALEKKEQFFVALKDTLNGLAALYNSRNEVLTPAELMFLKQLTTKLTIDAPKVDSYIARPDGFCLDDDTYKLIEMNYGNSMGGILALNYLQELYNQLDATQDCGSLAQSLVNLWQPFSGNTKKKIITHRNCGRYERYEQQNIVLCEILKKRGLNISFMDLKELYKEIQSGALSPGLTVSRQDILDDEESASLILEFEEYASQNGISAFNPIKQTDIFNSKVLLALYSEYSRPAAVVDSFWLGNASTAAQEKFVRRMALLEQERDTFVIKRDFSYQGKHVVFGDESTIGEWKRLLLQAVQDGCWIAQRVQHGHRFQLKKINEPNHDYPAIVSPFIFGHEVAGVTLRYRTSELSKTCVLPNNSKTVLGMIGFRHAP
ncbi:MAG: hypothetical protein R3A80_07555 [Bdellovibrionota bacterium]